MNQRHNSHGLPTADELERDLPDLCRRLVDQLDCETRGELRLLLFMLACSARGHTVESWLGAMFDMLEPSYPIHDDA